MSRPVEVKVNAAAIGTLFPSLGLALLNRVAADNTVLAGLPSWLQFIVITILPPLIAFLSGYVTKSSTSRVSDGFNG